MREPIATMQQPLHVRILHGMGSMSDGAQLQLVGGVLLLYYSQILGLPAQWVSLALGISLFVDAFWDPWLGHLSDNLRSRFGRRHPMMYFSAIPAGITFALLWMPPVGLTNGQLFAWLLAFVLLFRLFHSFYMVPSSALTPELAPQYHDRTVLVGFRWMLGGVGGAITAAMVYGIFLSETPDFPQGQLNPAGYPPMAIAIGIFITITILIASFGTHGTIGGLHRPATKKTGLRETFGHIAETVSNRNFVIALIAGALGATSTALYQGLTIYFSTYLFALPSSSILLLVLTLLISGPLAFVVAPAVSRRWGKKRACMALFFVSLIFTHGPLCLKLLDLLPPNGSQQLLILLLVNNTIGNVLGTAGFILSGSMIGDIVEESQVRTGRRAEGLLQAADTLLLKVVSGMATVLPGILLVLVNFPTGAPQGSVDPSIVRTLAMIYVPLAASLSIASIAIWGLYTIDQKQHEKHLAAVGLGALGDVDPEPQPLGVGAPPIAPALPRG